MSKYITLIFLALLLTLSMQAQKRISREYNNVSLSDAPSQLAEQQNDYAVMFLYNELEDFRITTTIRHKTPPDAIRQMIGFYPIRMIVDDSDPKGKKIFVECIHKASHNLTGTIINEKGQPVAYANIALLNPDDSTLLSGGVSNVSGFFAIPYDIERILARISYVGYKTIYRLCDKPNMRTIRIYPETQRLNGVTVKGQAPVLRLDAGTIIFDPRHIIGAINAKDLLLYTPGIIIDNENIRLLGESGTILCINGKEQKSQAKDILQLLQSYPASDVARIEIIQNPDARYAAEGHAGVINIILSKRDNNYFSGSVAYARTQYEKHGDEANAGIIYNKGRISTSLNLTGTRDRTIFRETNAIDFSDQQRFNTDNGLINKENYTLRWQLDYHASEKLNLGVYTMYSDGERHLDIDGLYNYLPASPSSLSNLNTQTRRKEDTKTWAVNINAVQELGDRGAKIDYNLDYYRMRMDDGRRSVCYETFVTSNPDIFVQLDTASFDYHNNIAQSIDNYSAKVDVSYANFKFGTQYVYTRNHLDLNYSGMSEPYQRVSSIYDEQVLAVYAGYGSTFGSKWSLNLGGRYEHTWTIGKKDSKEYGNKNEYGKLFPSLQLSYHPNNIQAFSLSLSSRISRPNIISLNPNMVWKDVNNASFGNQNLKPSYLHKVMMDYSYNGIMSFELFYAYQPNRVDAVYEVNKQTTYTSWDNITDEQKYGFNFFYCYNKLHWVTASLMQGIWYSKTSRQPKEIVPGIYRQSLYSHVEGVSLSEALHVALFFDQERKWTTSIDASFFSTEKDVAKKLDPRYTVDLGAQYRFWKNRLTIGLNCRNLFYSHIKGTEYLDTTRKSFDNKFNYRKIYLTLTYHWGTRARHHQNHYESEDMQERVVNDF